MGPIIELVQRYVRRRRLSHTSTSEWLLRAQRDLRIAHDYATSVQPDRMDKIGARIESAQTIVGLMVERMWDEGD